MSDNKKEMKENSSSKAPKKEGKDSGGGFLSRVGKFFREYRSELKKISWPTFSEVVKNTFITLVVVLMVGIVVWLVDWGVSALRDTLIHSAEKVDASDILGGKTSGTDAVEDVVSSVDNAVELTQEELEAMLGISGTDAE